MKLLLRAWLFIFIVIIIYFLVKPYTANLSYGWFSVQQRYSLSNIIYSKSLQLFDSLFIPTESTSDDSNSQTKNLVSIEHSSNQTLKNITNLEKQNTELIIRSIKVKGPIIEGKSSDTMNKGFWHYPGLTPPGGRGNLIIIGHRYLHTPPHPITFYDLDKLSRGDIIQLQNKQQDWTYLVYEKKIVNKNDLSVLEDYGDYRLTLITCHPLWTSDKRLVIIAKLKFKHTIT